MAYINDQVFDQGLNWINVNGTRVDLCSQEPTNYSQATSTYSVGNKDGISISSPVDGVVDGRRVIVDPVIDGIITKDSTATHWAITNGSDTLIAVQSLENPQEVLSGDVFRLSGIDIIKRDV